MDKQLVQITDLVKDYADIIDEQREKLKAWEACADNLIDYAHDFVAHLSLWGKGYNRYDQDIKQAEDAIEEYLRLKK